MGSAPVFDASVIGPPRRLRSRGLRIAGAAFSIALGLALGQSLSPRAYVHLESHHRAGCGIAPVAVLPARIAAPVESLDRLPSPPSK